MPENLQPPATASRLLSYFHDPHLPQILGDLMEEFNDRARSSGIPAARRWYWREVLRNVAVLIHRRPSLPTLAAALACLFMLHAAMVFAGLLAWREWGLSVAPAVAVRPGWMGWSWGMAWPATPAMVGEFYVAVLIGLVLGAVFARVCQERVQAFRLMVIAYWLVLWAWFVMRALFFINTGAMWHGNSLFLVRALVRDFAIREFMCAGAFWIGTYLGVMHHAHSALNRN